MRKRRSAPPGEEENPKKRRSQLQRRAREALEPWMWSWKTQWLRDERSLSAVRATERLEAAVCSSPSTWGGGGQIWG